MTHAHTLASGPSRISKAGRAAVCVPNTNTKQRKHSTVRALLNRHFAPERDTKRRRQHARNQIGGSDAPRLVTRAHRRRCSSPLVVVRSSAQDSSSSFPAAPPKPKTRREWALAVLHLKESDLVDDEDQENDADGASKLSRSATRRLKAAFHRLVLKYHPDVVGDDDDDDAKARFRQVQSAYDYLLGRGSLDSNFDWEEGDEPWQGGGDPAWSAFDWYWSYRFRKDSVNKRTSQDNRRRAETQVANMAAQQESPLKARAGAGGRRKRRIVPLSDQQEGVELGSAATNDDVEETAAAFVDEVKAQAEGSRLQQQQEEQQEVSSSASAEKQESPPSTSRSNLQGQLDGLRRASRLKAGHREAEARRTANTSAATSAAPSRALPSMTHDSRAREERFVRLAVLASQWRDSVDSSWDSWDEMDISDGSGANLSDVNDRLSPRELLQAAVEGAATGAC